ncbi:MAG TPA: hypothetical protein VI248_01130 [Kineosporiaceae bacterium]
MTRARRGLGRHATPVTVGRVSIAARALVCLALVLAGVLLAVSPREEPVIVATSRSTGSPAAAVMGAGLILLGWVPVADLLIRGRHDVRRAAGVWPARTAPAAAVLSPVVVLLACLAGSSVSRATAAPAVGGGAGLLLAVLAVLAALLVVQGWALAALWRRSGTVPDLLPGIQLPSLHRSERPGPGPAQPGDGPLGAAGESGPGEGRPGGG